MFLYTFNENKRDELIEKGFRMICKQYKGSNIAYTFEMKPSFFALFSEEDRKEIFVSNKMTMA